MSRKYRTLVGVVAVAVVCAVTAVAAQQAAPQDGSIAALTNEVRLLRLSVEKSAQTQSQVQAMSIYLSAQQNRLNQAAARADALSREYTSLANQVSGMTDEISMMERVIATGPPDERKIFSERLPGAKQALGRLTSQQSDLRLRLTEANAAVQADLTGWGEMIARLEQLTRQ